MQKATYRQILIDRLARRQAVNPSYSLRAFARDLKLSPASISLILSGRQGLSLDSAREVSKCLELPNEEAEHFVNSVLEHHSRSKKGKTTAQAKAALLNAKFIKQKEHVLSNWLSLPVLEYLRSHPKAKLEAIASAFEMSEHQVDVQLKALMQNGLLQRSASKWSVPSDYLAMGDEAPSQVIRGFHQETLKRASRALEEQSLQDRMASSTIFSIDPKKKSEAFQALKEFRKQFCVDHSDESAADAEVYCLSIQFFKTHRSLK